LANFESQLQGCFQQTEQPEALGMFSHSEDTRIFNTELSAQYRNFITELFAQYRNFMTDLFVPYKNFMTELFAPYRRNLTKLSKRVLSILTPVKSFPHRLS
jgi:hypothetical protein